MVGDYGRPGGLPAKCAEATCEGSTIAAGELLLFSTPYHPTARANMTVLTSRDAGLTYDVLQHVGAGPSAYSALILLHESAVGLVYESAGYGALTFRTIPLLGVKSDDEALLSPAAAARLMAGAVVSNNDSSGCEDHSSRLDVCAFSRWSYGNSRQEC